MAIEATLPPLTQNNSIISELPLVSIVIVNWNRKEDLIDTLPSIYNQNYEKVEIIVVDNGSDDGTVEMLQENHPEVRVIALDKNLGPCGGRNIGVSHANGELIFFLDSDASLRSDTILNSVRKFQEDPQLGATACKVINANVGEVDYGPGWPFSTTVDPNEEFYCFTFSECGCVLRKEAFEEVGGFWEYLFFGREGEDLCLKLTNAGYKIMYVPSSVVEHRIQHGETRIWGGTRDYYDFRNNLYIGITKYPLSMLLHITTLRSASRLLQAIRYKRVYQVWIRAWLDVFKNLPFLLKNRQPLSKTAKKEYVVMLKDHGSLSWDLRSWIKDKLS